MANKQSKNLRHRFLVDPPLQKRILATFLFLGIAMVFVQTFSSYLFFRRLMVYINENSGSPELYAFITETWTYTVTSTIVLCAIVLTLFLGYGLVFSNRIAGPIYRLNQAIDRLLNGEENVDFSFRGSDYFQSLSERMKKLSSKVRL